MRFLRVAIFLLGIKVSLQSANISWGYREAVGGDSDEYFRCTVMIIEKLRQATTTNVRLYVSDDLDSTTSCIVAGLFRMNEPLTIVLSKLYQFNQKTIVHDKMCISIVNNEQSLRRILMILYNDIHHQMCVICLTFSLPNDEKGLARVTKEIWTTGTPRNVVFILPNFYSTGARIIGVQGYSEPNCLQAKLVQVGQYRGGKFSVYEDGLYARLNDLGGCELSVMVQPPMLPYVEKMENSPGGMIGDLMETMARSLNFTPNYVWSVNHRDMVNHIYSRDLNIIVDMTPRATLPATDYRFSVGVVAVGFIVPRTSTRKMWNSFFSLYDGSTWLVLAIVLTFVAVLSTVSKGTKTGNAVLKIYGTLLGVGVRGITSEGGWMRVFLWFWLLPAYVLVQSYLAYLTKNIMIPVFVPDIQTLNDLAHSRLDLMCSNSTRNAICKLQEVPFPMLCAKCRIVNDEEIWSDFYPNLMRSSTMNDTSAIANCEFLAAHPAFLNVHALDEVTRVNQFIEVRPGSAWIFELQKIFQRVFASGLIHYWRRRFTDTQRRKSAVDSIHVFHSEFGWNSFGLLIIGWLVASGCFLMELIFHRLYLRMANCITRYMRAWTLKINCKN